MVVDALALLLGERASGDIVRPGAEKTIVEGAFEFGAAVHRHLLSPFAPLGVDLEEGRPALKRGVLREGKSCAWVNGSSVTMGGRRGRAHQGSEDPGEPAAPRPVARQVAGAAGRNVRERCRASPGGAGVRWRHHGRSRASERRGAAARSLVSVAAEAWADPCGSAGDA